MIKFKRCHDREKSSVNRPLPELNRWARYRAVGTKDATITGLSSQQRSASLTLIVEQTRIGGHGFRLLVTAYGTDESGFPLNGGHLYLLLFFFCRFAAPLYQRVDRDPNKKRQRRKQDVVQPCEGGRKTDRAQKNNQCRREAADSRNRRTDDASAK